MFFDPWKSSDEADFPITKEVSVSRQKERAVVLVNLSSPETKPEPEGQAGTQYELYKWKDLIVAM